MSEAVWQEMGTRIKYIPQQCHSQAPFHLWLQFPWPLSPSPCPLSPFWSLEAFLESVPNLEEVNQSWVTPVLRGAKGLGPLFPLGTPLTSASLSP